VRPLPVVGALVLAAACSSGSPVTAPTSAAPTAEATATVSPSAAPSPRRTPTNPPVPLPTATTSAQPAYHWSSRRVTAADLPASWHAGCPVGPSQLRLLTLPYRDFSGARRTGQLVVNARVVTQVAQAFRDLYAARFPIRSLRLVDEYGGDDDRSMAADNTSAFNCRNAVGGSGWSQHAYGLAIDVNPRENPYVYGGQVLPPEGAAYTNRSDHRRGMTYPGSAVNRAFARQGWSWGGRWHNPDYQHFSTNGK
jgi:hypothetical protein